MTTVTAPKAMSATEQAEIMKIVNAFTSFKERIQTIFDEAEKVEVELQFESTIDGKHYNFASDEVIFFKDLIVAETEGKLAIVCTGGVKDKAFEMNYADSVMVHNGTKGNYLNHIIDDEFSKAFADVEGIKRFRFLENKLKAETGLAAILSNPEKWLKDIKASSERETLYSKIENYGIF